MSRVCVQGHRTTSVDVCDVCGAPMPVGDAAAAATQVVPAAWLGPAGDGEPSGATTVMGSPLRDQPTQEWLSTTSAEWVAEVSVDPAWYQGQQTTHRLPTSGAPQIVGLAARSALIGRRSSSRGTHPDLDCSSDPGVSRRHAQLTFDGQRWSVQDLDSSNGTFVARGEAPLPDVPISPHDKVELGPQDRVYLGAWTRIVIRSATGHERGPTARS